MHTNTQIHMHTHIHRERESESVNADNLIKLTSIWEAGSMK